MNDLLLERLSIILPIIATLMGALSMLSTIFLLRTQKSERRYEKEPVVLSSFGEGVKWHIRKPSVLYIGYKRITDIFIGLILMILTSIVFLIIGPVIYIQDPGPIFYKQKIIGFKGKSVYVYKFRSFTMDSINTKKEKPLKLRKYFSREDIFLLPVAFSILKGDISLVGLSQHTPGTINEEHMKLYQYEKPGLVYLKMVLESDAKDAISEYLYDLNYLNSRSIIGDWEMFAYAFINVALTEL